MERVENLKKKNRIFRIRILSRSGSGQKDHDPKHFFWHNLKLVEVKMYRYLREVCLNPVDHPGLTLGSLQQLQHKAHSYSIRIKKILNIKNFQKH